MKEHYIPAKVTDLFHVKHSHRLERDRKMACIMNTMHSEIMQATKDLEYRLLKKLSLSLKEQL